MCHAIGSLYFGSVKRFAASTLGRLGISAIAEVAFGLLGNFYGRKVCTSLVPFVGKGVLFLGRKTCLISAPAAVLLTAKKAGKTGVLILTGLAVAATTVWAISSEEEISKWGDTLTETVSSIVSLAAENLGGFIGLELVAQFYGKGGIVYWDPNNRENCYLVSMMRYQAADLIYRSIINPTLFILKVPCAIGGTIFKTAAFNMHLLVPFGEKVVNCLKKNQLSGSILQPFLAQTLSRRFLSSKPEPLQQSKVYDIFLSVLKTTMKQVLSLTSLKNWNDLEFEDLVVRLAGQAFKHYTIIIKHSPEIVAAQEAFSKLPTDPATIQRLDEAIRVQIQKQPSLSQTLRNKLVTWKLDAKLLSKAGIAVVDELINLETSLTGVRLLSTHHEAVLKGAIPIYLKHFLNYAVLHLEKFTSGDLEPCEELAVVLDINNIILSGYINTHLPPWAIKWSDKVRSMVSNCAFDVQKKITIFSHKGEQRSNILRDQNLTATIIEQHMPDFLEESYEQL